MVNDCGRPFLVEETLTRMYDAVNSFSVLDSRPLTKDEEHWYNTRFSGKCFRLAMFLISI
jgi:hypothetical protein